MREQNLNLLLYLKNQTKPYIIKIDSNKKKNIAKFITYLMQYQVLELEIF